MSDKIVIPCSECGRDLSVPATAAGKKVRCPKCKTIVSVPGGSSYSSEETSAPIAVTEPPVRRDRRVVEPTPPVRSTSKLKVPAEPKDDDWLDDEPTGSNWDSYGIPDQLPQALPPRSKKKNADSSTPALRGIGNEASTADQVPSGSSGGSGGVITGILMMVGAVVWFVGGLAAGIIFYYPPVLFVLGFIALVKGIMKS